MLLGTRRVPAGRSFHLLKYHALGSLWDRSVDSRLVPDKLGLGQLDGLRLLGVVEWSEWWTRSGHREVMSDFHRVSADCVFYGY